MEEGNLVPYGQSFIGIKPALTTIFDSFQRTDRLWPLKLYLEIKAGETTTYYVDGVVDSSRYYVVRIKVSCYQL